MSEEVKSAALDSEVLPEQVPSAHPSTQFRSEFRSVAPSSNVQPSLQQSVQPRSPAQNSSPYVPLEVIAKQIQLKHSSPMTQLEQDVPWKLVFVVYVLFAVGALILFALFLMTMIRIYKQQAYCS